MEFTEIDMPKLTQTPLQAAKFLQQQVHILKNGWTKFANDEYIDWNKKFKGVRVSDIKSHMQIPNRDEKIIKNEYYEFWSYTISILNETILLLKKKKKNKALVSILVGFKKVENNILKFEREERQTYDFLIHHQQLFGELFDNNYGKGFFSHTLKNYENRFEILNILKREYDIVRYFLSDLL